MVLGVVRPLQVAEAPRGPAGADVQQRWRVLADSHPTCHRRAPSLLYSNLSPEQRRLGGSTLLWGSGELLERAQEGQLSRERAEAQSVSRAGQKPALSEGQVPGGLQPDRMGLWIIYPKQYSSISCEGSVLTPWGRVPPDQPCIHPGMKPRPGEGRQ